jgi:hypothetical protein
VPVAAQCLSGGGVEDDGTVTGRGLGRLGLGVPADGGDLVGDEQLALVEVDVGGEQADGFAV